MKGTGKETMDCEFEQFQRVGIFTFCGELTSECEDDLKMVLMKAIHSSDRAVLNFKKVSKIDFKCLHLIRQAYLISVRLKNPLILTNVPEDYSSDLLNRTAKNKEDKVACKYVNDESSDDIAKKAVYN
ncbi:MAG: hypothetical protein HY808_04780 [Nitrospirae bacterium]|nr:hypothetical protein [Nitrospirota bacterium]